MSGPSPSLPLPTVSPWFLVGLLVWLAPFGSSGADPGSLTVDHSGADGADGEHELFGSRAPVSGGSGAAIDYTLAVGNLLQESTQSPLSLISNGGNGGSMLGQPQIAGSGKPGAAGGSGGSINAGIFGAIDGPLTGQSGGEVAAMSLRAAGGTGGNGSFDSGWLVSIGGDGRDPGLGGARPGRAQHRRRRRTGGQHQDLGVIRLGQRGGNGGGGGNGGAISIVNAGRLNTEGTHATGIFAESIGGGGGEAGDAQAFAASTVVGGSVGLGGRGGAAGTAVRSR